ncbi:phosphoglycerate mutase (2,3-diphosphoglycerate-independent) [Candidatus Bipolaricaulota sp. J31]
MIERGAERLARKVSELLAEGHTDYWLPPLVLWGTAGPVGRVRAGDAVIFCCRRGEREVQLTRAFVDPEFDGFPRERLEPLTFVTLTLYHPSLNWLPVAFAPRDVPDTLAEVLSRAGAEQLHLAEREKFAHVTYFFNGGRAEPFPGETDRCVPSFSDDPLRALPGLVDALGEELVGGDRLFGVVNIASGDILGHSTSLEEKIRCAEAVDRTLREALDLAHRAGYTVLITADHGLLEDHGPRGGPPNTSHTTHPVPFLVIPPSGEGVEVEKAGKLGDVAPTVLSLLGIPIPKAMTGRPLLWGEFRAERVLLVVLDGWGLGEEGHVNPIELAHTPMWDELQRLPMARLAASGEAVGLLPGRKGNSEAGHMNLGAGRVVPQDEVRIEEALRTGRFANNPAFHRAIADAKERGGALHLIGLLSRTSSHGSMEYVFELLKLAHRERVERVYVHFITDGRSTPPGSAPDLLREAGREISYIGTGTVVTAMGRGIALDRSGDYAGKTRRAYEALVSGQGVPVPEGPLS